MSTTKHEYEIMLLLSPSLSETDVQEKISKFVSDTLGEHSKNVTSEEHWGKKTLAYPINKEIAAHYVVLRIQLPGEFITGLDEEIRLNKSILRHLITRTQKDTAYMSLEEIEKWNAENLPQKKRSNAPKEKRAPRRPMRSAPPPVEKKPPVKDRETQEKEKKIDKAQLDKKLDEILDGDLNL